VNKETKEMRPMRLIIQRKNKSEATYGREAIATIISGWKEIQAELQEQSGYDVSQETAERIWRTLTISCNVDEITIGNSKFLLILIHE